MKPAICKAGIYKSITEIKPKIKYLTVTEGETTTKFTQINERNYTSNELTQEN